MKAGRRVDLLVVGAGPAGAAAAVYAARAGLDTLVVDRAAFPRDKCCGDGLTTMALRELERIGFTPEAAPSWRTVTAATVRSPSGRERTFPLPADGAYAAVARRTDLDAALVELARTAGARVADGCGLTGAAVSNGGRTITADIEGLGPVTARWAVGADGMWSPLRKALGCDPPGYRGEWHAFRQYFGNVGPEAAEEMFVWFEADLLPAYAWSFPLPGGRANVGFGIRRNGRLRVGDMGRIWSDLLTRPHLRKVLGPDAEPEAPHRSWPIPARIGRVALTGPRTLFAGDAAAATDPMTGEGIGQALVTGRLAAEAVIAAVNGTDHRLGPRHPRSGDAEALIAIVNGTGNKNGGTGVAPNGTGSRNEDAGAAANGADSGNEDAGAAANGADSGNGGAGAAANGADSGNGGAGAAADGAGSRNEEAGAAAAYERSVRRELVADDRLARAFAAVLSRPLTARAGLRAAGATDWTRRNFARWMFEDYPRAVLATPRRWRAGLFSAPGAFGDRTLASRAPGPPDS